MEPLIAALLATFLVSLISLVGIVTLSFKVKLDRVLLALVGFATGGLLGGAFLHLMPEAIGSAVVSSVSPVRIVDLFLYLLLGFIVFFILEKVLHWRHCHKGKCSVHTFTYLNLIGDGVHNFIDGLVIVAAFLTNMSVGIATTLAVAFHEIPQEIGDFAVLLYGGFSKKKALMFNFFSALIAVLGALVGFFIAGQLENFALYLLPFAAGGFIYIAATDLIPELHKETKLGASFFSFAFFIIGLLMMWALTLLEL
jgi:zinc and cadmium transporter